MHISPKVYFNFAEKSVEEIPKIEKENEIPKVENEIKVPEIIQKMENVTLDDDDDFQLVPTEPAKKKPPVFNKNLYSMPSER